MIQVDWKRVAVGVAVGFPTIALSYYTTTKVNEYAMGEIQKRLDRQSEFFIKENASLRSEMKERDAQVLEAIRREQNQVREDIKELRGIK